MTDTEMTLLTDCFLLPFVILLIRGESCVNVAEKESNFPSALKSGFVDEP